MPEWLIGDGYTFSGLHNNFRQRQCCGYFDRTDTVNPNHAQLICTTHDVLLLDEDIRRDQIWFVDKDEYSVSNLYALSDFKDVRKNSDILKRYLLGVYGAIPDLSGGDANE